MATYLNKIKILDSSGHTSSSTPFNFGIGMLREEDGNIVYGSGNTKKVFLAADGQGGYTLDNTVLQEYIDQRDTFLKKVEYDSKAREIVFTFTVGNKEIEDGVAGDTNSREEVIRVPVKDFAIDADNIYFTFEGNAIRLTESFGQYKPDSVKGYVDVPLVDTKGNKYSVQDFFKNAYQVVNNEPQVTAPSASIELYKNSSSIATSNIVAEVGSTPKIYFKIKYTDGNFQYTGDAKCEWGGGVVECQGKSIETVLDSVQSLTTGQIKPGENPVTLTYAYGESTTTAKNNLDESTGQTISAKSNQTATATYYIQGNYYAYGGSSNNALSSDADTIKTLKSKGNSKASSFQVAVDADTSYIMIAIPSDRKITKIEDKNAFGTDILNTFIKEEQTVSVTFGDYSQDYIIYKYSTTTKLKQNTLTVYLTNN